MLTVREALTTLYREEQGEIELSDIIRNILIEFVQEKFDKDFNGYGEHTMSAEYKELFVDDKEEEEKPRVFNIKEYANKLQREAHLLRVCDGEHDMAYALEQVAEELREIAKGKVKNE